ncbi:Helix-turn-helix domain-containing protein [Microvirga guangxiensis]|uniref:Helix-turn-helix domain-containing protein n=1 Tax=Microvirga guangxiensis TaxID=549386 RepID=A0A1G5KML6_9HYPH|nr:helix-turn-helix transcriptional regulator [Microvirga guangxiensis]SCZ01189.1 Helix-turn-helix domain-containing protein [Microvirga guangxiensis]
MLARSLERTRKELSDFLRHHRQRLTPADVGLPSGRRRRTPGLRREEVATLAGVGITWYTWLEQGREIGVSEDFLLRLAKVLKLDDAECCHLFLLAHRRPPPAEPYHWPVVSPLVQQLMDELEARPAYVLNLRWDIIAWNPAADRLFGFSRKEPADRNMLRMVFADPHLRCRLPTWGSDAPRLVASLRRDLALVPDDSAMLQLIDDLKKLSPDFRHWWNGAQDHSPSRGLSSLASENDVLKFQHEVMTIDEYRHLRIVVYFPEGSREILERDPKSHPVRRAV